MSNFVFPDAISGVLVDLLEILGLGPTCENLLFNNQSINLYVRTELINVSFVIYALLISCRTANKSFFGSEIVDIIELQWWNLVEFYHCS